MRIVLYKRVAMISAILVLIAVAAYQIYPAYRRLGQLRRTTLPDISRYFRQSMLVYRPVSTLKELVRLSSLIAVVRVEGHINDSVYREPGGAEAELWDDGELVFRVVTSYYRVRALEIIKGKAPGTFTLAQPGVILGPAAGRYGLRDEYPPPIHWENGTTLLLFAVRQGGAYTPVDVSGVFLVREGRVYSLDAVFSGGWVDAVKVRMRGVELKTVVETVRYFMEAG